jgi:hypothetical protein
VRRGDGPHLAFLEEALDGSRLALGVDGVARLARRRQDRVGVGVVAEALVVLLAGPGLARVVDAKAACDLEGELLPAAGLGGRLASGEGLEVLAGDTALQEEGGERLDDRVAVQQRAGVAVGVARR